MIYTPERYSQVCSNCIHLIVCYANIYFFFIIFIYTLLKILPPFLYICNKRIFYLSQKIPFYCKYKEMNEVSIYLYILLKGVNLQ